MIVLGAILLILGFVLGINILWTIGIVLLVIGAVLWLLGSVGRPVADLHGQSLGFALVIGLAGADSQHFTLIGLFSSAVRDDDARCGLGFVFHALDDDAVCQRTKIHGDFLEMGDK